MNHIKLITKLQDFRCIHQKMWWHLQYSIDEYLKGFYSLVLKSETKKNCLSVKKELFVI